MPSVATGDKKQFQYFQIVFNNKTTSLVLEFDWCEGTDGLAFYKFAKQRDNAHLITRLRNTVKNTQLSSTNNGAKKCVHCKNNLYVNEGFSKASVDNGLDVCPTSWLKKTTWGKSNNGRSKHREKFENSLITGHFEPVC